MIDETLLTHPGVQLISILAGIALLIAGQRLYWLLVGAVGFVGGLALGFQLLANQPAWLILLAAVLLGLAGIVVAIFLQAAAIGLAGFLVGGYALTWLLQQVSPNLSQWGWLAFIIGGVIGLLLAVYIFDAALIILSALTGAALIMQAINLDPLVKLILFVALVVLGIIIQSRTGKRRPSADSDPDS